MAEYGKSHNEINARINRPRRSPPTDRGIARYSANERVLAEAWARSTMLVHVPPKPPKFNSWIFVLLLFIYILPALIYAGYISWKEREYETAMAEAIEQWHMAGEPDPYAAKTSTGYQETPASTSQELSLEKRIIELASLKERGLITEEEYLAAKRKILELT